MEDNSDIISNSTHQAPQVASNNPLGFRHPRKIYSLLRRDLLLDLLQLSGNHPLRLLRVNIMIVHLPVVRRVLLPRTLRQQQLGRRLQLIGLLPGALLRHRVVVVGPSVGRPVLRPLVLVVGSGRREGPEAGRRHAERRDDRREGRRGDGRDVHGREERRGAGEGGRGDRGQARVLSTGGKREESVV